MEDHLTVPEVAKRLGRPDWLVRRVVDTIPGLVARAGQYRLIPAGRLSDVQKAIEAKVASYKPRNRTEASQP